MLRAGYDPAVVRKVLLASPRGYCAGVERAVETVEKALELYGPPVYVRKQIVHNLHVVRDLEARGAVFVDDEREVPEGETVVFSAHGVAPSVHVNATERRLHTLDATCPLVTKVHVQARRYAAVWIHDRADRPRRPRGGRRDDGRGAGVDRARRVARRRGGPLLPRGNAPRIRDADDPVCRRDVGDHHRAPRAASPTSTRRRRKTSVTRLRTGSGQSRRCWPRSTSCS